jgi:diguanylate cyclase (GGDEF)-like protein
MAAHAGQERAEMVNERGAMGVVPVVPMQPRIAWLRRACYLAAVIAGSAALILTTLTLVWQEPELLGLAAAAAALTVWLVAVGRGAVEGHELRSILLVSVGIYVLELVGLFAIPASIPVLALASLVPLVFAAPYLDTHQLGIVSAAVGSVIIAFVVGGALLLAGSGRGVDVGYALAALGAAGVTLLVLFLLEQSARTASGLRDLALHDGLTGLHNRTLFIDRLDHAMMRAQRRAAVGPGQPTTIAVLYLDIDGFKDINDRYGHGHGDALLRAVADRLHRAARAVDTVARIGGDEFAILIEELADRGDVLALTDRLMESMNEPILLPEGAVVVTLSAGLAFSDDGAETGESLLQNADHAMYHAKRRALGDVLIYDPELRARSEERRRLKRALQGVTERGELRLHYQPLVRLNPGGVGGQAADPAGSIAAVEALVRWQDPELGLRLPGDFIGLAEETGDIMPIGRWVLETTCRQLRAWQAIEGRGSMTAMVNLSALELEQRGFGGDIRRVVDDSGITPHSLVFELTEHAVVPDRVRTVLDDLQGCGVHLVIDDFGTGYSSLSYLSELPIDGLKIARAFVQDAVGDRKAIALLRAIIEVGAALGAVVVAEGIETEEQLQLLRSLGCDLGQGHVLAPALAADELEALLRAPVLPWADALSRPAAAPDRLAVRAGVERDLASLRVG